MLTRNASVFFLLLFSLKTASLDISREEPASPQELPAAVSLLQGGDYAAGDTASVVRLSHILQHRAFWCPAFLRGELLVKARFDRKKGEKIAPECLSAFRLLTLPGRVEDKQGQILPGF